MATIQASSSRASLSLLLAPAKGIATFRTTGSSFDTLLAVYTGDSFPGLTLVQSDEDRGGYLASEVQFNVQSGVFYQVAIDGYAGGQGDFILSWSFEATSQELPVITGERLDAAIGTIRSVLDAGETS